MPRPLLAGARYAALVALAVAAGTTVAGPEPAAPVAVTVHSPSGRPLAGVRVSVLAESQGAPSFEKPVRLAGGTTNTNGVARLAGLDRAARCTLVATPPDARWRDYADLCLPRWQPADATVKLAEARAMRGVVHDVRRQPAPFARVYAEASPFRGERVAAADGTFAFENLPPGQATVYAEVPQKRAVPVASPRVSVSTNDTGVVLVLASEVRDPRPALIVRVATPNGRPAAYGEGTFYASTTRRGRFGTSTSSFSSGVRVRGGVASTEQFDQATWFEVVGARTEYGERLPFGPARGGPFGPGPREGRIVLPPEQAISGVVLGPDDAPLGGVRVHAVPAGDLKGPGQVKENLDPSAHGEGISDAQGRYRVGGLEQRRYRVEARPTPDYVPSRGVEVPAGARDVEVRVRLAARPRFTIKDPKGKALRAAVIRVEHPARDEFLGPVEQPIEARTDAKGEAGLVGLDPEIRYKLTVYPPTERADLLPWEIPGWIPEDTVLTLERARLIAGVVHDQHGRPIPRARLVWARVQEAVAERVVTLTTEADAEGKFALKNLRPGNYRVWVRRPLRTASASTATAPLKTSPPEDLAPATVPSGSHDLVLVLRMPSKLSFKVRGWMKRVGSVKALLVPEGARGERKPLSRKLCKEGTVEFTDLQWDLRYAFWVGATKEDAYVYEKGLWVDDGRRDYTLKQGVEITGRVVSPRGTTGRKVWASFPGFDVKGKLKSAGRFVIKGLPEGPWTIRASGKKGKARFGGETKARAGEDIVVTLEPE